MNVKLPAIPLIFLTGSLCGALVLSIVTKTTRPTSLAQTTEGSLQAPFDQGATPSTTQPTRIIKELQPFQWSQLESTDYKVYIANLRAVGCPEKTIRDLVRSELDHLYRKQHEALEQSLPRTRNYWDPGSDTGPGTHYAREQTHRRMEREKKALLNELLGDPGGPPSEDSTSLAPKAEGNAPDQWTRETRERVHEIQHKYDLLEDAIHHKARGDIYPEDAATIAALRKQRLEELGAVLTPEQLHELELRESRTAEHMRNELLAFQPSEDEFRSIFDIRQTMESELGLTEFHFESPEFREYREGVERRMEEEIRALLGEERFADYKLGTDHEFRDLYKLGERFGLPEENVRNMYDLRKQSEEQIHQIRSDETLGEAERNQTLELLRQRIETEGQTYLGAEGYYNYRSRGGEWMHRMFGED